MAAFLEDFENRKWVLQPTAIMLVFAALIWIVWLYYSYYIEELECNGNSIARIFGVNFVFLLPGTYWFPEIA
ncbi:hypothetical protein [Persicitalea sp.]|uniref:hypothetical protein n=1 Tax=Persicitalea sp. TaxID=3100273 RepID=UPI003593126D